MQNSLDETCCIRVLYSLDHCLFYTFLIKGVFSIKKNKEKIFWLYDKFEFREHSLGIQFIVSRFSTFTALKNFHLHTFFALYIVFFFKNQSHFYLAQSQSPYRFQSGENNWKIILPLENRSQNKNIFSPDF